MEELFKSLIREIVKEELKNMAYRETVNQINTDTSEVMTATEVAKYLKISRPKVYSLMEQSVDCGGIPHFTTGDTKRPRKLILKSDLKEWIQKSLII